MRCKGIIFPITDVDMTIRSIAKGVLLALAATVFAACKDKKSDKTFIQPCKIITAQLCTLENKWYYVGEVKAKTSTGVGFRVPGTVMKVYVNEGDQVAKGQLLAELDPQDMQNSYNMARATLNQAEDAMRRVNIMHSEQSISDIKYVEVQTKLEQARSAYSAAKKRLDDTKLYAPVAGVIGWRSIEVGENYGMLTSAFTILDLSEVVVKIPIPEREISKIKKGDEAKICVLALGDSTFFNARISKIGVSSDPLTHSYEARLNVKNSQRKLMEGMVCNVQLWPKATQGQQGFVLPVNAVKLNPDDDHYVWVVRNGKAYRQSVDVGMYSKDGVIVYGGIRNGEHIITEGQSKICEGQTVKETR